MNGKIVDVAKSGSSIAMNYSLFDISGIQNSQYYYLSLSYLDYKKVVRSLENERLRDSRRLFL
jgi:hypothetical protein